MLLFQKSGDRYISGDCVFLANNFEFFGTRYNTSQVYTKCIRVISSIKKSDHT